MVNGVPLPLCQESVETDMRNKYPKPLMQTALTWPPDLRLGWLEEAGEVVGV